MKVDSYEIEPKADLSGADLSGADLVRLKAGTPVPTLDWF